jgi:hypothetical protein
MLACFCVVEGRVFCVVEGRVFCVVEDRVVSSRPGASASSSQACGPGPPLLLRTAGRGYHVSSGICESGEGRLGEGGGVIRCEGWDAVTAARWV